MKKRGITREDLGEIYNSLCSFTGVVKGFAVEYLNANNLEKAKEQIKRLEKIIALRDKVCEML
jgi:hypothetical protein